LCGVGAEITGGENVVKQREIKIKVCGMREPDNLRAIAALQPEFFGLIFYTKSSRYISPEDAETLPQFYGVDRVGVFVNEKVETMQQIARRAKINVIQLHGDESPEVCVELKNTRPEPKLIKVFSVGEDFDGSMLTGYEQVCDYFLFDTKTKKRGGSGESFDWNILRAFPIGLPFFLSGGIGVENAREAVAACKGLPLYGIDLNSKVEVSPGVKSPQMIKKLIKSL
jgi:phosphoribosylanthranilate isomerase